MKYFMSLFILSFWLANPVHAQRWVCDNNGCRIVRDTPAMSMPMRVEQPYYGTSSVQYYNAPQTYSAPIQYYSASVQTYTAPQPAMRYYNTPYGVVTAPPRQYYRQTYTGPFGGVWAGPRVLAGGQCGCPDCVCGDNCRCGR